MFIKWLLILILFNVLLSFVTCFECPRATGQFPDPESCRHFYSCNDFYPYRLFCPEGLLYDGAKNDCVDRRKEVKCGPQPTTEATITTPDPLMGDPCDATTCVFPDCFCSADGTAIPGGLQPKQVPQMIMITFDGGVNQLNYDHYNDIFLPNRTNPNGCPLRATFFMSHQYTNYKLVQQFYSEGHEMAVGSITRRAGLEDETPSGWSDEMVGMSLIMNRFAGVNESNVIGMRSPHLKPGKNSQYESLINEGFYWDSSLTVPPQRVPVWPYTLDHTPSHECKSGTCPTHPFPGVWEFPMNSHYEDELYSGGFCPYLDQCVLHYLSAEEVFEWLSKDFDRYYNGNRAPYMMTLTANWFNQESMIQGLHKFIDSTLLKSDVYYVTVTEALEWIYSQATVEEINKDFPWICNNGVGRTPPCSEAKSCPLHLESDSVGLEGNIGGTRYMVTCEQCPRKYPWVGDPLGTRSKN